MKEIVYIAGVFDARGFVRYEYGTTYKYAVHFNFTKKDKKLWLKIKNLLSKFFVCKIYKTRKNEYQLYIGGKKQTFNFLKSVLPYSFRKKEISLILNLLEKRGYKKAIR